MACGAGAGQAALPDPAVESTPASNVRKAVVVAVLAALVLAVAPVAEAQSPIRIGASLSHSGSYAAIGPNLHRGCQLCVKHMTIDTAITSSYIVGHEDKHPYDQTR
jgi:hypothetical protein